MQVSAQWFSLLRLTSAKMPHGALTTYGVAMSRSDHAERVNLNFLQTVEQLAAAGVENGRSSEVG